MENTDDSLGARWLPDEYARLRTRSADRLLELVGLGWGDRGEAERRDLAQVLLTILEPLNHPGAEVTEDLRVACEQAIAEWVRSTVPAGELLNGSERRPADLARDGVGSLGRRVVKLVGAQAADVANGRCAARVTLERSARRYTVATACRVDTLGQLRGGANSTIEALRQAVPESPLQIEVGEVGTFEALGRVGVIVSVAVTEGRQQSTLVGVCPDVASEPVRAAAIAVLNAMNRRMGIG